MKKIKIILISIIILLLVILLTSIIFTSNYKILCEREESGLTQIYYYEFNLFGNVKKFKYETHVFFEDNDSANICYEENINLYNVSKDRIKLEKNVVIFDNTYPEQKLVNNIFQIKKTYTNLDYICKVVKK